MMDYGATRTDYYSYFLCDPITLTETGEQVDVVQDSGNVTYALDSDNYYSAKVTLHNTTIENKLLKIKHVVMVGDETDSETLGTFFVDGSSASAARGLVSRSVNCYSTLYRFTQDVLARDFSRPAGYNIVQEVRELIEADGGRLRVLPGVDTSRTHTIPIWFEVGTNRASVLEQIAAWTSCELGVDENGYITWGPYLAPEEKELSYTFEDGVNCVYVAGFDLEDTRSDAVNRVVAHFSRETKQTDDPYPLSDSVYVDLPDTHPYSYKVLGRRKTYDMDVSDPCSHDDLMAQALRYLDEHKGSTQYYTIQHVGVPRLRPGQKVRYINRLDATLPLDMECIIEEMSMDLGKLNMCKTKLRMI